MDRDKNIEIYFEIKSSLPVGIKYYDTSLPLLHFEFSNYGLSKDEKLRASVRPRHLALDDGVVFTKTNEIAYLKDKKNILKLNYRRLNDKC